MQLPSNYMYCFTQLDNNINELEQFCDYHKKKIRCSLCYVFESNEQ